LLVLQFQFPDFLPLNALFLIDLIHSINNVYLIKTKLIKQVVLIENALNPRKKKEFVVIFF